MLRKLKYIVMSPDQNAGQNRNIKIYNKSSERVEQFRYFGTTLKNKNSIQEEITSRMKSGNACYPSVQNPLSFSTLTKNIKIKMYRTITLPVVLYGCETWSFTMGEEHGLRMFKNRVRRKIFGSRWEEVIGEWRRLHIEEVNELYPSPNIIQAIKSKRMRWARHVAHMRESRGAYMVLVGKPGGKWPLEDPGINGRIILKWILKKWDGGGTDWIDPAQTKDRRWALVNAVMNLQVP